MMLRERSAVVVLFVAVIVPACCFGRTIYVDSNSPYDPGSGADTEPFLRIQDAIDASVDDDVIEIRPGLYVGIDNYDLDPGGRTITIRGAEPADLYVAASTIIDAGGAGRGFCFQGGQDANCLIMGLTVQNCSSGFGGGILCQDSSPTISNCIIRYNSAIAYGGGIFLWSSSARLEGCAIYGNSSAAGGGVECWSGQPTVTNCVIAGNKASDGDAGGGGVDCYDSGNAMLRNCTLAGNSASEGVGGGLLCVGSEVSIENCIFWWNAAGEGSQIAVPSWFGISAGAVVSYSDLQGGQEQVSVGSESMLDWRAGNFDLDPDFVAFDPDGDAAAWDLHLRSACGCWDPNGRRWVLDETTSPCIDAGDPNSDWSGELWPNGKRINVGAYGGTMEASLSGNPADFDMDGAVDFEDFCELADNWELGSQTIEDLNRDGRTDVADLGVFAENWLWRCKAPE